MPAPWSKQPLESLDPEQLVAFEARRDRIVSAAERLMGRHGPGVTMAEVAAEAGLGMSSVYRTFASKDELLDELAGRRADRWLEIWLGVDEGDPIGGLVDGIWAFAAHEAADPLADVVRDYVLSHRETFSSVTDAGEAVIRRAHAAGLPTEVTYEDVVRAFVLIAGLPREPADGAWRRPLAIYVDGLFGRRTAPLPPAA
jgi:AcrR family transcriptional regulator